MWELFFGKSMSHKLIIYILYGVAVSYCIITIFALIVESRLGGQTFLVGLFTGGIMYLCSIPARRRRKAWLAWGENAVTRGVDVRVATYTSLAGE